MEVLRFAWYKKVGISRFEHNPRMSSVDPWIRASVDPWIRAVDPVATVFRLVKDFQKTKFRRELIEPAIANSAKHPASLSAREQVLYKRNQGRIRNQAETER